MYEYLIGVLVIAIFWFLVFLLRKDLRKAMVLSGLIYMIVLIFTFAVWWVLSHFIYLSGSIIPDYWNPDTLFNLGRITKGLSIEDALFMFFVGGIVTVLYEIIFKKRIINTNKKPHKISIVVYFLGFFIFTYFVQLNIIYTSLILPSFLGAIFLIIQRKDLIKHSIIGALLFTIIYFLGFLLFDFIFPNVIESYWNLNGLSGIILLSIPIEELLYAFSFGLMWSPMYIYFYGKKEN